MDEERHILIARADDGDETREVHLVHRAKGGAHIRQFSHGPLTQLAYGDKSICQQLSLDAGQLGQLAALLGWSCGAEGVQEGLERFFAQEGATLADLLDLCGAANIACVFSTTGGTLGALSTVMGVPAQPGEGPLGLPALSLVP